MTCSAYPNTGSKLLIVFVDYRRFHTDQEAGTMASSHSKRRPKKTVVQSNSNGTPKYQPMPDLSPDEFEVLKADIAENGLLYSVIKQ